MHTSPNENSPPARLRIGIVMAGLVLEQLILFGPSLIGSRILMPLDLLASLYLPRTAEYQDVVHRDNTLSDLVVIFEPSRQFAATELRAGRVPLWNPYAYAGAPFATFAKYSPFMLLYYLLPSPLMLAWMQLLSALVAGGGASIGAPLSLEVWTLLIPCTLYLVSCILYLVCRSSPAHGATVYVVVHGLRSAG
jgi:hypothetical protein